jgi:hypothetical protein
MSGSNKFDFKKPYQSGEDFDSYIKETEYHLKNRIDSKTTHSNLLGLITVLTIGLLCLAGYLVWQTQTGGNTLSLLQQKKVAGVQENPVQNIFSGEGFSIVFKSNTPKGFESTKKSVDFPYIKNKKGVETTFYSKQEYNGIIITDSISIVTSEFDNANDLQKFSNLVVQNLGVDYEIKSSEVAIPKNIKLSKIQKKNSSGDVSYFAAITEDNYYMIKIINESRDYPELEEYTKFTESFLEGLYLN